MIVVLNKIWLVVFMFALVQCNLTPANSEKIIGAKDGLSTFNPNVPGSGVFNPNINGGTDGTSNQPTIAKYKKAADTIDAAQIDAWKNAHAANVSAQDKAFTKYVFIDREFVVDETKTNKARVALFKALNHVAIHNTEVKLGEDVSEGHGVLWAIDLRDYFGNSATEKWNLISQPSYFQGMISAPDNGRLAPINGNLTSASRLVYNVMAPDVYVRLIETPAFEHVLQKQLGFPAKQCEAMAGHVEAIVYGSRIACMRYTADGRIYWNSADNFDGREGDPLPYLSQFVNSYAPEFDSVGMLRFPGVSTTASEAWVEMKNGFLAYYIWGNTNQRRGRAEAFVDDPDNIGILLTGLNNGILKNTPFNPDNASVRNQTGVDFQTHYLETGRSCISCHAQGPQSKPSDMATAMKDGTFTGASLQQVQQYWSTNEELNVHYESSRVKFQKAMAYIVNRVSDGSSSENNKLTNGADGEPTLMMVKVIDRTAR